MRQARKEDLSVYYFLKDLLPSQVNVVDAFPETLLTLPTVSIETKGLDPREFELGNNQRVRYRTWYIEIFGSNKTQRDDMTYQIVDALESCIPVYDYDLGFPPDNSPPQLGCLEIDDIHAEWIRVLPQLVDKMYYRTSIIFTAFFNQA